MNFPKSINIGGLKVKLTIVENLEDFGSFSLDDLTISIKLGPTKTMIETIRHEMTHAAFAIGGIAHCENFKAVEEGVTRCQDYLFWPAWESFQERVSKLNQKHQ